MSLFRGHLTPVHAARSRRLTPSQALPRSGVGGHKARPSDHGDAWSLGLQPQARVLAFGASPPSRGTKPGPRPGPQRPRPATGWDPASVPRGIFWLLGPRGGCGGRASGSGSRGSALRGPSSPGAEHCVAGTTSSSSLSEELPAVLSEAWTFLPALVAWAWARVAAGPAGLRLGSTKIRGVLITLKNKNRTQPAVINGLAGGRQGWAGEGFTGEGGKELGAAGGRATASRPLGRSQHSALQLTGAHLMPLNPGVSRLGTLVQTGRPPAQRGEESRPRSHSLAEAEPEPDLLSGALGAPGSRS